MLHGFVSRCFCCPSCHAVATLETTAHTAVSVTVRGGQPLQSTWLLSPAHDDSRGKPPAPHLEQPLVLANGPLRHLGCAHQREEPGSGSLGGHCEGHPPEDLCRVVGAGDEVEEEAAGDGVALGGASRAQVGKDNVAPTGVGNRGGGRGWAVPIRRCSRCQQGAAECRVGCSPGPQPTHRKLANWQSMAKASAA